MASVRDLQLISKAFKDPNRMVRSSCSSESAGTASSGPDQELFIIDRSGDKNGLIARYKMAKGTRILEEAPLFTLITGRYLSEADVMCALQLLTNEREEQFYSLPNNYPDRDPILGIISTNQVTCVGPESVAIFPTISLIKYSCQPNAYHGYNRKTGLRTIHGIRDIAADEPITITESGGLSYYRREMLKKIRNFTCNCRLCSLPSAETRGRDERYELIKQLRDQFHKIHMDSLDDELGRDLLRGAHTWLQLIVEMHEDVAAAFVLESMSFAFRISMSSGDLARAGVFASHMHRLRTLCLGEDHPTTRRWRILKEDPTRHRAHGGRKPKTRKDDVPIHRDIEGIENWLWRKEG